MDGIPDITHVEALLRLSLAAGCGAIIGLEREWRDRAAGLRTHMLVSVGSALFTLISLYGFNEWIQYSATHSEGPPLFVNDPSRIAAQIVSGIGFIGAGAIWRTHGSVNGLTTAATLWSMAAIGMAAGVGAYDIGAIGTGIILFVLLFVRILGRYVKEHSPATTKLTLEMRLASIDSLQTILNITHKHNGSISNLFFGDVSSDGGRTLRFDFIPQEKDISPEDLIAELGAIEGIYSMHVSEIPYTQNPD